MMQNQCLSNELQTIFDQALDKFLPTTLPASPHTSTHSTNLSDKMEPARSLTSTFYGGSETTTLDPASSSTISSILGNLEVIDVNRPINNILYTFASSGSWTSCRCSFPWGIWEYIHKGGGRRIHQENISILSAREPTATIGSSTDYGSYCIRRSHSGQPGWTSIEDDSQRTPAVSDAGIAGAAGGAPKIRIGRRLADLFIQSGTADISSFRQWISSKKELRQELEALLYSKKWKDLV